MAKKDAKKVIFSEGDEEVLVTFEIFKGRHLQYPVCRHISHG